MVTPNREHSADVMIRNLGATGASNVRLTCTPPLQRSSSGGAGHELVPFPESLPFLAPGQEWRTLRDFGPSRAGAEGIEDRYEVTATYADFLGVEHITLSVLDRGFFRGRMWVGEKTMHDAAQALDSIAKILRDWSRRTDVVKVATYDGEAYDRQVAVEERQARAELRDLQQAIEGQQPSSHDGEKGSPREA